MNIKFTVTIDGEYYSDLTRDPASGWLYNDKGETWDAVSPRMNLLLDDLAAEIASEAGGQ